MTTRDRLRQIHTILEAVDARCIAGNVVLKASDLITDEELREIRLLAMSGEVNPCQTPRGNYSVEDS